MHTKDMHTEIDASNGTGAIPRGLVSLGLVSQESHVGKVRPIEKWAELAELAMQAIESKLTGGQAPQMTQAQERELAMFYFWSAIEGYN